jgi:hypothetical protein
VRVYFLSLGTKLITFVSVLFGVTLVQAYTYGMSSGYHKDRLLVRSVVTITV